MHNNFAKGRIQVYTGDGKGKTTAAIGVTVRALGAGMSVLFTQFLKDKPSSEHNIFRHFSDRLVLMLYGAGGFIKGEPTRQERDAALTGWEHCKDSIAFGDFDLIVMDELNVAVDLGLIPIGDVVETLKKKQEQTEIIITGRGAHPMLIELADLVTEMKDIKHYYTQGVQARIGIEK